MPGGGGLFQLYATGAGDIYFTGNPQFGVWFYGSNGKKQKASNNPTCNSLAYSYLYEQSSDKDNLKVDQKIIKEYSINKYNNEILHKSDYIEELLHNVKNYNDYTNNFFENDIYANYYKVNNSDPFFMYKIGLDCRNVDENFGQRIELGSSINEYKKELVNKHCNKLPNDICNVIASYL